MKRTLPLIVAFALLAVLAPSPAGAAADESISYNRDDTASLLGAAAYFDTIDPNDEFVNTTGGEFAAAGANTVFFVLNLIGDTSPTAFDATALPADGPYVQTVPLSDTASTNLDWLVTKYSGGAPVTRVDMLRFGAAILTFLSGANAGANGVGMPPIDPGPPPSSTSSTTSTTLDPGDPCNTLPLPQASCALDAWKVTWGSTISLLHKNVQTMADSGPSSTCTDMHERARNMAVDAGPHAIAALASTVVTEIENYATETVENADYDCTGGGDRSAMVAAVIALGNAVYGDDFGWWLTNQLSIQRLENIIDAPLQYQYGCDAIATVTLPAPPTADDSALNAALTALGTEDDCGFNDGAVTPNSIANKGETARVAFDALVAAARNGSASYPLDDPTRFAINDELIAVRSLSNEIDPSSSPACEAIGFAATYIALAATQVPGSAEIGNAKTAIDAMNTDCGTGAAAATYTAQQPVVKSNLDTALGWTI